MNDEISPGVRDLVTKLQKLGYTTTDSGDGSNYAEGMECALPYRHVFGTLPEDSNLIEEANKLQEHFPEARIEVSYSPEESAIFMVFPDGYKIPEDLVFPSEEKENKQT